MRRSTSTCWSAPSPTGARSADDGELAAPLVPNTKAGTVLNGVPPADAEADDESDSLADWLPDLGSRWVWTGIGGALAAVAGVFGFAVTRRPRRR